LLAICFAGCSSSLSKEEIIEYIGTNNYPIETCRVTYSIDVTNLKEVVGDSDYVIVAEVKDYISTTYSSTDFPITHYSIKVIENIKGSLDTSCEIELIKEGGLSEKNDKFITYENDFLPQIGQTYIFCLYGQSSGGIRACGEGSVIKFENILDYKNSQTYLDILDAYDNEIVSNRTRYQSKYEVG
jgi:hypothetical protein